MKFRFFLVFILLFHIVVKAQQPGQIKVNVSNMPLNKVLLFLKENYNFQFAFDTDLLSKYKVTINEKFSNQEETLKGILTDLPFNIERSGEVFLIIPKEYTKKEKDTTYTRIAGQVLEAQTREPLPFSYISVNNRYVQTDRQGHFKYLASADTSYNLRISHLGYFVFDTLVTGNLNRTFFLTPRVSEIAEVKVTGSRIERSTQTGDSPGKIKLNHRIAPVLPGHGDNSVFNLLRLMPGILASGEQSNDLLIWGSYESHSKVMFDGFTVFGLKNFNDNISVVNPFVVKTITVFKGGYDALLGDRAGGIVDITGKNGTLQKPSFSFNINNTTLNSLVEIPLSEKSTLLAAYRQTYYQLYDPSTLNLLKGKNSSDNNQNAASGPSQGVDFSVIPDYRFRDANLKYTLNGDNGSQFFISLYGGGDRFLYDMEGNFLLNKIYRNEKENNQQLGGSVSYNFPGQNNNKTRITAGYSVYERTSSEKNELENTRKNIKRISRLINSENNVDEFTFQAEKDFSFLNGHKFTLGTGFINNKVKLLRKSFSEDVINLNNNSPSFLAFIQDELPLWNFIQLKTGLRTVYSANMNKLYPQPRISASVRLTEKLKLNAAWGIYNQFMAKTSVVDSTGNFSYFWTNSDGESIPVLKAVHNVGGISYSSNGFDASLEVYYKNTDGLTRFFNGNRLLSPGFYQGEGKSRGLDLFIKKEFNENMAWISYSLSKTEEHFPFYIRKYYQPAPHHQTHELKFAGIINFGSFYLSANYVYGSGFEKFDFLTEEGIWLNQDYSRLDAALVYKFRPGKVTAETGISVINLFDKDNIKYSNLRRATIDEINLVRIYAEALPFIPAIFLMVKF